jgi:hypothetical protein
VFRKGDNVVITEGVGSRRGQVVTSYGPAGPRGDSGAAVFGGKPADPGLPITDEMIVGGRVQRPEGGFEAPAIPIIG